MPNEKRRDLRYPLRMPVLLRSGGKLRELFTEDVSLRGLFVRTEQPPGLRNLLQVELNLAPDNTEFRSYGMSVFVVSGAEPGRVPGAGIQFYAMGDQERVWRRFVEQVRDKIGAGTPEASAAPETLEGAPSSAVRHAPPDEMTISVRPRSIDELLMLYTRDISMGWMFLRTSLNANLGTTLRVEVVHPETLDVFPLSCAVRRRDYNGLDLELLNMDKEERLEFYQFVFVGKAMMDETNTVRATG